MNDIAHRMLSFVESRGGPAKDVTGKPIGNSWPMMLEAAAEIQRLQKIKKAEFEIGFASFIDGTFELTVCDLENGKSAFLTGPIDPKTATEVAAVLPSCVYVRGARSSAMPGNEVSALRSIVDTPYSTVNDAESLRHTIKTMQDIARRALNS